MDEITTLTGNRIPIPLRDIPDAPKKLFIEGKLPDPNHYIYLTVVGSRKYSSYGKEVCDRLIQALSGRPVVIVSGLAIGIDTLAHRAALKAGLKTIAVPGSGLDRKVLYPRINLPLAEEILEAGGALLSEFPPETQAATYTFPKRNRIMAGLAKATLIIEATQKSGTLITARLALDYNREVLAVPGSILADSAFGTNKLIREGATPITESNDLLEALGFEKETSITNDFIDNLSTEEKIIYELLKVEGLSRDEIVDKVKMDTSLANTTLSMMEIKGLIKESGGIFIII